MPERAVVAARGPAHHFGGEPGEARASSLGELRRLLDRELDRNLRELREETDAGLVRTSWSLAYQARETDCRIERLEWRLGEIRVPGEAG